MTLTLEIMEDVLEDIYRLISLGELDKAIDQMMDWVDKRCSAGNVEEVDEFFRNYDFERGEDVVALGMLTITLPWKDKLKNRAAHRETLWSRYGDRAEEVMRGL